MLTPIPLYFKNKSEKLEIMDFPGRDKNKLINTVRQFSVLNFLFSRSRYLIRNFFIKEILIDSAKTYSFLDIGAGGGDIAIWLAKICLKLKIKINITCLDIDEDISKYSKKKCELYKNIIVKKGSVFDLQYMENFDIIFSNNFLHHIPEKSIPKLLNIIYLKVDKLFLINDIYRSIPAYFGYSIFALLFIHNSFAFYDGRLSIKRGFTDDDYKNYINESKFNDEFKFLKLIPSRIVLYGKK